MKTWRYKMLLRQIDLYRGWCRYGTAHGTVPETEIQAGQELVKFLYLAKGLLPDDIYMGIGNTLSITYHGTSFVFSADTVQSCNRRRESYTFKLTQFDQFRSYLNSRFPVGNYEQIEVQSHTASN